MCLSGAINNYAGTILTPYVDYVLQDDGNGPYIVQWNNTSIAQPTMEQLNNILSGFVICPICFLGLANEVTNAQLAFQYQPILLLNKIVIDYTDNTLNLLEKVQVLLSNGSTTISTTDYAGNFVELTQDDITNLLNTIMTKRLDLQNQETVILQKIKNGQPYTITFN